MANKNTKNLKNQIRKASKKGIPSIDWQVCVKDYHSTISKPPFITKTFPCAVMNKDGVNSKNEQRNMQQKIYKNTGASQTFHEILDNTKITTFKNHSYLQGSYKQSSNFS